MLSFKNNSGFLKEKSYAITRLMDSAAEFGVELDLISSDRIDLTVTREDRKSILLDGKPASLPDFIIPRMGAFTTYFDLAVIRHLERLGVNSFNSSESIETVKDNVQVANAKNIPFEDNSFDVVISINTIHNLERDECFIALQEIERVSKSNSFITVDAYRNDEEKEKMYAWNLTAKTIMSVDEWVKFFEEAGYTGDYYWFIP